MPYNAAGLNAPTDINSLSLHSTNPGLGVSPVAGELSDAPYSRQACSFSAPVSGDFALAANVVFNLSITGPQNVQFVGVWKDTVYKGYFIPDPVKNFTAAATARSYTLTTDSSIVIANP